MKTKTDILGCDREPIHLLGAIQPIGFLISVNSDWLVIRASTNIGLYLGEGHDAVVGSALKAFIPSDLMHDIRGRLQLAAGSGIVERLFGRRMIAFGPAYDIAVHQSDLEIILEFEPSIGGGDGTLSTLRGMIARLERQATSQGLFREAARHIRALTGFDRVMVYRFNEDGDGDVVAEAARGDLPPFLGLRYPASDIPAQARALYELNFLRSIADVDAVAVAVMPVLSPEGNELDLSMSTLRSVSPIHLEYLKNMGVRASLSISIIRDGRLWGLIACHHMTPRQLGFEARSIAELFGQTFSFLVTQRERSEEAASDADAQAIHDRVAAAFSDPLAILENASGFLANIADYLPSDGIGVYCSGQIALTGMTPTREEFLQLVRFLNKTASGKTFSTHSLSDVYPPAADFVMRAAGLLSIPISRVPRDYLVFFRREVVTTVTWAGEPIKAEAAGPNGVRLSPRKSFDAWRQIVQNQSEHWTARERRISEALRITLVELILRLTEAAEASHVESEQRQEFLIAELNHRVRNILGLVRGLITQSAASAADVRTFVTHLDDRIRALASAHDILTSGKWKAASLHDLLRAEVETYSQGDERLVIAGPDVLLEPRAFSAMAMVVHELVTNANKYGALKMPQGQVRVETFTDEIGNVNIRWQESGGPVVVAPVRRGFGTTILEQAIPFEVNGTSVARYLPEGFLLDILLPPLVAHCLPDPGHTAEILLESSLPGTAQPGTGAAEVAVDHVLAVTLVVEDNLFIAVDAEDMLLKLGAGTIDVVRSVAEALAALAERRFTFALLDVNLGAETSLPVALALQAEGIPFIFGTGYGEALVMPGALSEAPIITKPYNRASLLKALMLVTANNSSATAQRDTA